MASYDNNVVTGEIDERGDVSDIQFWASRIDIADHETEEYREQADDVIKAYEDDGGTNSAMRQNILWSNTQILKSALMSSSAIAKPDVRRRFSNGDAIKRQAAIILEKALSHCLDEYDPSEALGLGLWDALVPGMGIVRVQYDYDLEEVSAAQETIGEDGEIVVEEITTEVVTNQRTYFQYHYWKDFLWDNCRSWADCDWIAFRHMLTKEQLVERFGEEKADDIPLNSQLRAAEVRNDEDDLPDIYKRARIWEIWDKAKRQRVWYCPDCPELVEVEDDPMGLKNFFPIAKPLCFNRVTESMVPIPIYAMYEDQAEELNMCVDKLHGLTESAKLRGVYDGSEDALARWSSVQHNEYIPIDSFAAWAEKGGIKAVLDTEDIAPVMQAIETLMARKQDLIQSIYDITGIADIMRAASDPRETAKAQQLKGKFGSMRLQSMIQEVICFVRDLIRIQAEIIAEQYTPETLAAITGEQVTPEVVQVLRDDKLRSYSIDIETESSVFEDAQNDRRERMEFLNQVNAIVPQAMQAAAANPKLGLLYLDLIDFGMRSFKKSRVLEETFDSIRADIVQQMQQPKQPKQDPEMQKAQAEIQVQQMKVQADLQLQQQKAQADLQLQQAKFAAEQANEAKKLQMKLQNDIRKLEVDARLKDKQIDAELAARLREQEADLAARIQELQMEAQLENQRMRMEAQMEERQNRRMADIQDRDSRRKVSLQERKLGGGLS